MASSVELVDRMDHHEAHGRYRFEHMPPEPISSSTRRESSSSPRGDLFLRVEDEDANSIATGGGMDDYVGLEIELEMQRRTSRKRTTLLLLIIFALVLLVGGIVYSRGNNNNNNTPSSSSSQPPKSPGGSTHHNDNNNHPPQAGNNEDGDANVDNSDSFADTTIPPSATLWPTMAPLPTFRICPPPRVAKDALQKDLDVFHLHNFRTVPESPTQDDYDDEWEYTISSMDVNDEASIIAVGMSDFSADTEYEVGLVRVFAYDCDAHQWKQLGQDLLGTNLYEEFGRSISSSRDGRVMAISAPQESYEGGTGFVEVYYLDENRWKLLGGRIENLKTKDEYSILGHAIDLSDKGETLAVLALVDTNKYVIRVFQYNYNKLHWVRKGHDLSVQVEYADGYPYYPTLSLSEDGDRLAMADPQSGVVMYQFNFAHDKWKKVETKSPTWKDGDDYWIETVDMDDKGDLVAFSAFASSTLGQNYSDMAKVVDFSGGNATDVYEKSFEDFKVGVAVAVSDDGRVAAVVGSRVDVDDDNLWLNDVQYVGSMSVVTKDANENWRVVGQGTKAEGIGVPGFFVSLSGDGRLAAVGSDVVVALYGIKLSHNADTDSGTSQPLPDQSTNTTNTFEICAPFPRATANMSAGDLDHLPKQANEHTLSIAMSENGSVVAVGIDSYKDENRGMARVFGWDCSSQSYSQLGQDLFGTDEFDGFGQSVALSSNGKVLVVGANQPPPGRSGYVEVYSFEDGKWKLLGKRLNNVESIVEDLGREVRVSDDGSIVMFSGSIVEKFDDGWHDTASFIRVVEYVDDEWKSKGDDLKASIEYDEFGADVHIALSSDGTTLAVTGSYSNFMAKIYSFDAKKKNWTESIIPPIKGSVNADDDEEWDEFFADYFSGQDISLDYDGRFVAIAGSKFTADLNEVAVVRVLKKDAASGNWTLSRDPIDYKGDYTPSSVAISADGQKLAVGINGHSDSFEDQGALFVAHADNSDSGWTSLGKVDGRNRRDLLGSRVCITRDGTLAAASSRKGYVSFFKIGK